MKNKKGFTLIELLAVIVILAVILAIAGTAVINSINDSREKTKYLAAQDIANMAEAYMVAEKDKVDDNNCVSVKDMVDDGYVDSDATNPLTGENISSSDDLTNQKVCKANTVKQDDYAPIENEIYCFDGFVYKLNESSRESLCESSSVNTTTNSSSTNTTKTTTKKSSTVKCYQNGIKKTSFAPGDEFYCTIGLATKDVEYSQSSRIMLSSGYPKYESNRIVLKYTSTGNVTIYAAKTGYVIEPATIKITNSPEDDGNSCLVEGTKIKTIDGYKNIEDINYDDLLATWSYDLGKIVYEYPIWIEKESSSNSYQETTFSDGTVLKTVGFHGIYSYDLNRFVSVDDKENFKVGTHVAKIENGKLKKVTVTKIEHKNEKTNYYHIESTRYYNVIANDLLTTDGYVELTNLYDFNSNITWNGNDEVLQDKNNLYSYSDLKQVVPYYLYKGLRIEEAKYLVNNGVITKESLIDILNNTMLNDSRTKKPITKGENRYWMVTLDTDNINTTNKEKYLKKEGSTYTLPKDDNVKYWYNSSDNKYYKPGSKVKVYHGMHFTKIEK